MSKIQNEFSPKSGKVKYLMVLLHGVGSNGDDLFNLVPYLADNLEDIYFYSPNAIEECDMAPFGYQWFSLQDRNPSVMKSELERVAPEIKKMISDKAKELSLDDSKVILFGFSQGSMTAMYLALSNKNPYHSVIATSGALIEPSKVQNTRTPICLIHGKEDEVVPFEAMEVVSSRLKELNCEIETLSIDNLAHSIDMQGIRKTIEFIKKRG